uniref:Kinesin-like protein n=1 Tax=Percolomonas cosmopolitus TaxID=63605 RepID=A0A7S1KUL6_9EUKA|mmetsp:Transcript_9411/g.34937  ORF Transcript_9411/g.34937 Transcript_9411/m.34937 type:complete len:962 (+) Transcript_9411:332-3217(+)|eukprot:CAMPEP_0117438212 /NCGR_PEP_ID=MMETSP0759-20121206/1936_1 /TAXON_ID=63605 /ORGANISM="Percolomonas cosmopolitus, Strain WS" /LENGTH=961 /DNA_ID=CAMNT_0005229895 /DNA_START=318 /DNA_END=3203 /DNA_ORIENTATION=+
MAKKTTKKSKKSSSSAPKSGNNVQVVARFRPQNSREVKKKGSICVNISDNAERVALDAPRIGKYSFNFDRIFGMESQQKDVFQMVGLPVVKDVFNGYNGTVFVYGQTGAGKSFSMMGPNVEGSGYCDDNNLKGLIPRIVEKIFETVQESEEHLEFTIQVSYIEIYMEKIRDLFDPTRNNLGIKEDRESGKGIYVDGCSNEYVTTVEEVFRLMKQGASNRVVAGHLQNAESSRSHSIFIITLNQKDLNKMESKSGTLFLVDLAGSEKVKKTQAEGQLLEEAKQINKSLSALGNVINALTDGKTKHIPYRDSKLTRLLQDSLGGNCRTTLIICCSPSTWNAEETVSTLRFGNRAKSIKNKAKVNKEYTAKELKKLLDRTKKELKSIKSYAAGLEEELKLFKTDGTLPSSDGASNEVGEDEEGRKMSLDALPHVAELRDRNDELEKLLEDEKKRVEELLDEKEKLEDDLQDAKVKIETKDKQLDEQEVTIKEHEDMSNQFETANSELEQLRVDMERLQHEHNEQQLEMDSLRSEKTMLEGEIEILKEDEKNKLSQPVVSTDALMKAYEDEMDTMNELGTPSTPSINKLFAGAATSTADSNSPRPSPLKPEIIERHQELLKQEKSGLTTDISTAATTEEPSLNTELQREYSELKDENKYFYEKIQQLSERNDKLEQKNSKLEKVSRQLKSQKVALMHDLRNRCDKVIELSVSLDEAHDEVNRVRAVLQTKEPQYQLEQFKKQLMQLRKNHQELVNKYSNLELQKKVLDNKLNIRNERIKNLEQALEKVIAKNNKQSDRHMQFRSRAIQQEQAMQREIKALKLRVKQLQQIQQSQARPHEPRIVRPLRGGKKSQSISNFNVPPSIRGGGAAHTPMSPSSSVSGVSSAHSTPTQGGTPSRGNFSLSDLFFNDKSPASSTFSSPPGTMVDLPAPNRWASPSTKGGNDENEDNGEESSASEADVSIGDF